MQNVFKAKPDASERADGRHSSRPHVEDTRSAEELVAEIEGSGKDSCVANTKPRKKKGNKNNNGVNGKASLGPHVGGLTPSTLVASAEPGSASCSQDSQKFSCNSSKVGPLIPQDLLSIGFVSASVVSRYYSVCEFLFLGILFPSTCCADGDLGLRWV